MGITAASLTSYAVHETLPSQSQNTGNNQITVSDDIQNITGNNGQVTGTDYIGRLIILNLSGEGSTGTEQTRYVINDVAGTGNTRILTVSEDWETNPSTTTSDTIHVFYNMGDLDAVVSEYNTRTGFYEMTNPIIVGNGTAVAGLFMGNGDLVEIEDSKSTTVYSLEIQNNGRLQCGYLLGGVPVAGAYFTGINNSQGETWTIFESGGEGFIYDTRMIASLNPLQFNCANGSAVVMDGFSLFQGTDEGLFFDADMRNGSITGSGTTTEILRVDAGSYMENVALIECDTLTTASGDTTTETLNNKGCYWISMTDYIDLEDNKTWNIDNPTWGVTSHTDINSTLVAGSATVNDRRTIDAVVQKADGTKIQNALVNVYEHTQLADLVLETTTDANGVASGAYNYRAMVWTTGTGATTTYGGHALQCGCWLYLPFVAAHTSTDFFDGTIVLSTDSNISETTQATAITNGSGITWSEPTNPTELIAFTGGSGTLAVGMILTFTPSGATGTIRESASGDSTAGDLYLDTRDATAIANGDTFSRTGGTAGTFSGTYTNDSKQAFSISINGNSKTMQVIYDYLAARQTETTLTATGELIWEWCRSTQTQPFYATGSSFYTEQSNSKGIWIYDMGAGTLDYFTDDSGTTWTPPTTTTVTFTGMKDNTEVRVYLTSDDSAVAGIENATAGTTDNRSFAWSALATTNVYYKIFNVAYEEIHVKGFIVPGTNTSIGIQQRFDRNREDPPQER